MTSEKHMMEAAKGVTGDDIQIAGLFSPRGASGHRFVGMLVGGALGSVVGDDLGGMVGDEVGDLAGSAAGMVAGEASVADHNKDAMKGGTVNFVVAVSPAKVYILQPESMMAITRESLGLAYEFDMATLAVTLHARVYVRTMTVEDTATGDKLELEGARIGWSHAKQTMKFLLDHTVETHKEIEEAAPAPVG
jgi:hypothetical protein